MAFANGFGGFVDAFDGGIAIETIDRDKMRKPECLTDNGPIEQRTLQENGDAAGDGADHRGCVGRTGMVCGKDASTRRDTLGTFDVDMNADTVDEEHDPFDASPVKGIDVPGEKGIQEQRRANEENVKREEYGHKGCAEHGVEKNVSNQRRLVKGRVPAWFRSRSARRAGDPSSGRDELHEWPGDIWSRVAGRRSDE